MKKRALNSNAFISRSFYRLPPVYCPTTKSPAKKFLFPIESRQIKPIPSKNARLFFARHSVDPHISPLHTTNSPEPLKKKQYESSICTPLVPLTKQYATQIAKNSHFMLKRAKPKQNRTDKAVEELGPWARRNTRKKVTFLRVPN